MRPWISSWCDPSSCSMISPNSCFEQLCNLLRSAVVVTRPLPVSSWWTQVTTWSANVTADETGKTCTANLVCGLQTELKVSWGSGFCSSHYVTSIRMVCRPREWIWSFPQPLLMLVIQCRTDGSNVFVCLSAFEALTSRRSTLWCLSTSTHLQASNGQLCVSLETTEPLSFSHFSTKQPDISWTISRESWWLVTSCTRWRQDAMQPAAASRQLVKDG